MPAKVFVGNLVFSIADKQLSDYFSCVGNVLSANIITRGRRSLGYGFIEFDQVEDAVKAVELMHNKEIDGRLINVELARPRDISREETQQRPRKPMRSDRRVNNSINDVNGEAEDNVSISNGANVSLSPDTEYNQTNPRNHVSKNPNRRFRNHRTGMRNRRAYQGSRQRSDTTLFVAEFPPNTTTQDLLNYFVDFHPKYAYIAVTNNEFSRGYGFVQFENQEDQLDALSLNEKPLMINDTTVKLKVQIALSDRRIQPTTSENQVDTSLEETETNSVLDTKEIDTVSVEIESEKTQD